MLIYLQYMASLTPGFIGNLLFEMIWGFPTLSNRRNTMITDYNHNLPGPTLVAELLRKVSYFVIFFRSDLLRQCRAAQAPQAQEHCSVGPLEVQP